MKPEIWGPGVWVFLHTLSLNYPENPSLEHKKRMLDFFNMLGMVLPCEKCQLHFQQHLNNSPIQPALSSRTEFINWLVNLHNSVNKSINKSTISTDEMLVLYDKLYKSSTANPFTLLNENYILKIIIGCLVILSVIMAIFIFKKFNISFSTPSIQRGGYIRPY